MTFSQSVIICFRKFATFSGRASRSEYWWFFLFCMLGGFVASFTETTLNTAFRDPDEPRILSNAFNIVTLVPSLAVGWRRMHDTGRSGLYLLYPLIVTIGIGVFLNISLGIGDAVGAAPEVGAISALILIPAFIVFLISPLLVLWWLTRPTEPGTNQYGPTPTEVTT